MNEVDIFFAEQDRRMSVPNEDVDEYIQMRLQKKRYAIRHLSRLACRFIHQDAIADQHRAVSVAQKISWVLGMADRNTSPRSKALHSELHHTLRQSHRYSEFHLS